MKRCHVPRVALPDDFKGSRKIEVGMSDPGDIFDRLYVPVNSTYMISKGALIYDPGIRYYHISTVPCHGPDGAYTKEFLETPCYCVKIINGIVVEITKHLPFQSKCKEYPE